MLTSFPEIVIKEVRLKNFMCHENFVIEFNKKLTCIGGRNGSGKSAIMVALGLCLGLRTVNLDRGRNYRNLIMRGKNSASITVVIYNHKRYKPDIFQGLIYIEKKLRCESMKCLIRNGAGRVYSDKKRDLDFILELFNIQFDNIINFLTQEQAKKFLNVTKPVDLYKLFNEGTLLSDVQRFQENTLQNMEEAAEQLNSTRKEYELLCLKQRELSEKLNAILEVDQFEETLKRLDFEKRKFIWLQTIRKNEEVWEEVQENKKFVIQNYEKNKELREIKEKIQKRKEMEAKENQARQSQKESKTRMIKERMRNYELEQRELDYEISNLEQQIKEKKEGITELENIENVDKIMIENVVNEHSALTEHRRGLEKEMVAVGEIVSAEKEHRRKVQEEKDALIKEINYYRGINSNKYKFFGENLGEITRTIKMSRFTDEVIGPLCFEVSLKEIKWSKPVSIILRPILNGFIVYNEKDRKLLRGILHRYKSTSPIFMPSSRMNRLIKYTAPREFKTVVDVIEVKSVSVLNQMVILLGIENIILLEGRDDAYLVIMKRPEYVSSAFLPSGDQIKMHGNSISEFRARNADKAYFDDSQLILEKKRKKLKEISKIEFNKENERKYQKLQELINKIDAKVGESRFKMDVLNKRLEASQKIQENSESTEKLTEDLKRLISLRRDFAKSEIQIKNKIAASTSELNDLQQGSNSNSYKYDEMVNSLSSRLYTLNQESILLKEMRVKIVNEHERGKETIESERANLERNYTEFYPEILENDLVSNLGNDLVSNLGNNLNNNLNNQENNHNNNLNNNQENNHNNTLNNNNQEKIGPKKSSIYKSVAEIEKQIITLNIRLDMIKNIGDEKDLRKQIQNLTMGRDGLDAIVKNSTEKFQLMQTSNIERVRKREELKIDASERINLKFKELIAIRGYEGRLIFNHEKKTLDVDLRVANPDVAGSKSMLSGGERSFAGISLLMALWSVTNCPVRVVDEFDVYMDNLNRKQTIKLIKRFVKENPGQLIILTPLSTDDLFDQMSEVKIVRKKMG